MGDMWSFYKTESKNGMSATAYDIVMNGGSRYFVFCNLPLFQRICKCQKCGIKIPREVPRIKFRASFHYGAGYYCLSCGIEKLKWKLSQFKHAEFMVQKESKNVEELMKVAEEVMADELYPKKMALGRMFQVMSEKGQE